ncbi:D-aminoacyl-tRNA deacylase [Lactobacillus iners]|jgi:hypothetical protein|uniref:D-aminoacyl-tRNA deacylase n=1 Tax=Lactobacillus iners TaxID=147802 RepID=UPI00254F0484|nr:D-aminoacyl-tRNA deacylase [Lactobacillus iners]MCT7726688.1 D-aminoacyl-tRNA deacylase [Lactobacillus iners]MDK7363229.1 D-aminoacyl-tRNA deacylase [Lactobacillus iners]MDX5067334.1 D-aminoacyl-tRNA deacylase [Lactobacillus iners]MDX5085234.1 D-aminoacyl-tRNA deacylase [Lactobacillus iners]
MRVVVQRVLQAKVEIDKEEISSIDKGMLLLVGIGMDDTRDIVKKMAAKISKIRIFENNCGKTNLNIHEVNGKILSVSQFTLLADTKKGNRPSFVNAMKPPMSLDLFNYFNECLVNDGNVVERGQFGADMQVSLINDGPMTIVLDL